MVESKNIKPINHSLQLQLSLTKYFATLLSCPCSGGRVHNISTALRLQVLWSSKRVALRHFPSQHIECAKPKKSSGSLIALFLDIPKVKQSCWTHFAILSHEWCHGVFCQKPRLRLRNYRRISPPLVLAVDDLQHVQPAWHPLSSSVHVTHCASRLQIRSAWKDPHILDKKTLDLTIF